MFSVVILTLNEEKNLPSCLGSAAFCDDLVVIDSGSTDNTVAIAQGAGARVLVNPFENFGAQRNFAHRTAKFRYPWVFHLDADERLTPELIAECGQLARENSPDTDGYWVAPRMTFRGRWIPHCTDYPAYQARFVHADRFRFIQVGHGQREAPEMRMKRATGNYLHDLSADGEVSLAEKHRNYAKQEAAAYLKGHDGESSRLDRPPAPSLISADRLERRRALKSLSQRLPARGILRFTYQYLLRRGFLDGRAGFAYCLLMGRYESWIAREIRRQRAERTH